MKSFLLIMNPHAGRRRGRALAQQVLGILETAHGTVVTQATPSPDDARDLAANLRGERFDAVLVIGGDGTVHAVVNGLMQRASNQRPPLGVIPAGTGNSLMHDLDSLDPDVALARILKRAPVPLDLLEVRAQGLVTHAFNVVGWGMWAEGNRLAERWRWSGRWRYDLAALWLILRRPLWPGRLRELPEDGGAEIPGPFAFVLASNTVHTGRGMRAAPMARFDDGRLELLYVGPAPRRALIRLFPRLYHGTHLDSPLVHHRRLRGFSLLDLRDGRLNLDGEMVRTTGDVEVRVQPGALRLLGVRSRQATR